MHSSDNDKYYRCCLCCHVKTGTILLGLWQVIIHMTVLGVMAALIYHPHLFNQEEKNRLTKSVSAVGLDQKNVVIVFNDYKSRKEDHSYSDGETNSGFFSRQQNQQRLVNATHLWRYKLRNEDRCFGMTLTFLSLVLSACVLYGGIKERPNYLLPYFCLQMFDFFISCLSIVGCFSYLSDVKVWLNAQYELPYKQYLLRLDQTTLTFTVLALGLFILFVKGYLLSMVWCCYKYFVRKRTGQLEEVFDVTGSSIYLFNGCHYESDFRFVPLPASRDETMSLSMLPPKYDDVLRTAPPSYFTKH